MCPTQQERSSKKQFGIVNKLCRTGLCCGKRWKSWAAAVIQRRFVPPANLPVYRQPLSVVCNATGQASAPTWKSGPLGPRNAASSEALLAPSADDRCKSCTLSDPRRAMCCSILAAMKNKKARPKPCLSAFLRSERPSAESLIQSCTPSINARNFRERDG
jgi:hypothetical protein